MRSWAMSASLICRPKRSNDNPGAASGSGGDGVNMPNQHDLKAAGLAAREAPTPVRLSAAERTELEQGAAALGETISATLRAGGLARARKALAKQR